MSVRILTDGNYAVLWLSDKHRAIGPVIHDNGMKAQRILALATTRGLDVRNLTFEQIDQLATDVEQAILDEDLAHELAEAARRFMRQANCTAGVAIPHAWDDLGCAPSPAVIEKAYAILGAVA